MLLDMVRSHDLTIKSAATRYILIRRVPQHAIGDDAPDADDQIYMFSDIYTGGSIWLIGR
jgi:hypothetical protein